MGYYWWAITKIISIQSDNTVVARACVSVCERLTDWLCVCVRACVRACVRVCVCVPRSNSKHWFTKTFLQGKRCSECVPRCVCVCSGARATAGHNWLLQLWFRILGQFNAAVGNPALKSKKRIDSTTVFLCVPPRRLPLKALPRGDNRSYYMTWPLPNQWTAACTSSVCARDW